MSVNIAKTARALRSRGFSRHRIAGFTIRMLMYVLLAGLVYIYLFPFLYMLVTSLKSSVDLGDPTVNWFPSQLWWRNYQIAFRALSYQDRFKNSVVITISSVFGQLLSCSFIAYGLARYNFRFKKIFKILMVLAIVIPLQSLIVPLYMTYVKLDWTNSWLPIIVPSFFGFGLKGGLFIFIFHQFFLGLPKEMEEAAKIDGCSYISAYFRIILPMARASLLVVFILSLVWHWNDYFEPSLYISLDAQKPLPTGIQQILTYVNNPPADLFANVDGESGANAINNGVLMAGCAMIIAPVIAVFAVLQSRFMQGIERTGIVE